MPVKPLRRVVVWLMLAGTLFLSGFVLIGRQAAAANEVAGADEGRFFQRDVFVSSLEGYHTFRIPVLLVTRDGTLLAFCEGRKTSRADLGNNDLLLKRSTDGGRIWDRLQLVYEEGERTIGNPTALVDQETGTIWLVLLRDASDVLLTKSTDDGQTWSKPVDIT
jgi:sialidase-1